MGLWTFYDFAFLRHFWLTPCSTGALLLDDPATMWTYLRTCFVVLYMFYTVDGQSHNDNDLTPLMMNQSTNEQ